MQNQLLVANPATTQNPDGQLVTNYAGRQGDALVSEVHGKWYTAGYRGATFVTSTLIAGITVPIAAATLAGKFTIWNPAGSGRICELISLNIAQSSATTVVNGIGLMIQRNLTGTSGIPTSLTAQYALPLGIGGSPVCGAYSAATCTNVAIPGVSAATPVPIPFYQMFGFGAVTNPSAESLEHFFDGRLLLGPDSLVSLCTTVATETTLVVSATWAEWPL
jgi:hypothetical protein